MNKGVIKNLALLFLLGVAVFSMARYVVELRAKLALEENLAKAQGDILALNQEKQNLLQELGKEKDFNASLQAKNTALKSYVGASRNRIARLFKESQKTKNELEEVSVKFAVLKAENTALIKSRKQVYLENEQLKFQLGSAQELKKALRALRSKSAQAPDRFYEGNRGFLLRDGRSTVEKVKIEVVPDAPQS